jgi:hypothetical protein
MGAATLLILAALAAIAFVALRSTRWRRSINGNAVIRAGSLRVTVFPSDGGWKFCIANGDDDRPYYSDAYETEDIAKQESLAALHGLPQLNKTKRETREAQETAQWLRFSTTPEREIAELKRSFSDLIDAQDTNITKLRQLERKILRFVDQSRRAYVHLYAERQETIAARLLAWWNEARVMRDAISLKIESLKAKRQRSAMTRRNITEK